MQPDFINGMVYNVTCKGHSPVDSSEILQKYTGTVVPSAKYDPPGTFRMSTDISDFPFRVITYACVVEVNDRTVCYQQQMKEEVRLVKGSKGDTYTVRTVNGRSTCTCPGFGFRKTCKHIESL